MTESQDALAATLKRMEANERGFRLGLYGAALLEAGFLAAFLLLADLKDRTQVLMLLNFAGLLSIVARQRMTDTTNGYRALRLSVLDNPAVDLTPDWLDSYGLEPYLLIKAIQAGYAVREAPASVIPRTRTL